MKVIEYYRMVRRAKGKSEVIASEELNDVIDAVQRAISAMKQEIKSLRADREAV